MFSGGPARLNSRQLGEVRWAGCREPALNFMYKVSEVKDKDVVLKIYVDEDSESPRNWDNLGTMVCWHSRYNLGDPHNYRDPDDFWFYLAEEISGSTYRTEQMTPRQREEYVRKNAIILPLYLYDHSGLTMRTYPFSCPWDSMQVGWIYVTKAKVREEYGVKRVTKKVRERVIAVLEAEVETYSQWLEGDVYGFVLEDTQGNHIDSCWGFYGTDWMENGMADHILEEYRYLLEKVA